MATNTPERSNPRTSSRNIQLNDGTDAAGRAPLRAKSFFEREQQDAEFHNDENTPLLARRDHVEQLEADVERLAFKCAALESQNILVAVQQLDLLTRGTSWALSISVLFLYWKFLVWGLPIIWHEGLQLVVQQPQFQQQQVWNAEYLQTLSQNTTMMRCLQVALLSVPYFYNRWTHGSMHRRFQVFVIAFVVLIRIRLCRWRETHFLQPTNEVGVPNFGEACTNDGIWEANYEISARYLYVSILRLKGLWTKTAQYLSSRADFMPTAYIRELSKLQDQAPVTPWKEVQNMLPSSLYQQLADFQQEPLASASIGQVHVARLGDQKVVIKVQHPHARTLMMDDFRSLNFLMKIIGWLEPQYAFMEILMKEWASEAIKELDFRYEAEHLKEASEALLTWIPTPTSVICSNIDQIPFQVQVPQPRTDLSSQKVLVMNFCEGCRIDNFEQLEAWKLSKEAVMDAMAQAFAHWMYCSTIFNGDPHAGNLLVRPGTNVNSKEGFTVVVLDWGLAKRLPETKRIAFCQMVYAAATIDYGLLLDSYKTVGLKMKREDAGQNMEDVRFFLRDMAPRNVARKRIKSKIKKSQDIIQKTNEKVPMESKAYPGEFFFFVRVNELLHGLGSRFSVNLGYLEALCPYAEKGLRMSSHYDLPKELAMSTPPTSNASNNNLASKLRTVLDELEAEKNLVGAQVCILKDGAVEIDLVGGTLGGLKNHIPMRSDALVLGYSTTKAITATLAHLMVAAGYLNYDEPVCERVWKAFCPSETTPLHLHERLKLPRKVVEQRWQWKRAITLRHILNHEAGLWSAFPSQLTIEKMASCEQCFAGFEYCADTAEDTVLPLSCPGESQTYHFMSFGWLVAGALCGAYAKKHQLKNVTYRQVYEDLLESKLSARTKRSGFCPLGSTGKDILAQTVTSDIRASEMIQRQRQMELDDDEEPSPEMLETRKMMEMFQGKEFLLDPRIWNSQGALKANVPAAGGRFSASGLAYFYDDLNSGRIIDRSILDEIASNGSTIATSIVGLQGVTSLTNDANSDDATHTRISLGYQLIRTDRDGETFSGLGHAGVGGSIGFIHRPTNLSIALMLNKADASQEITMKILRVIGDHYGI